MDVGWNNVAANQFKKVMLYTRGVPLVLRARAHSPEARQPEAFVCMPLADHSETFEQLALPLLTSLYNHAAWMTRDRVEAEDLVQETFSKALHAFASFEPETNFKAWMFRILRNTFLSSRTGLAATHTVFLEDTPQALDTADKSPTPEDAVIRLDKEARLQGAIEQLHPQLREVLLLCDVEGMKYKEIAMALHIPIGTVMSRVSRARAMLRHLLQPRNEESS